MTGTLGSKHADFGKYTTAVQFGGASLRNPLFNRVAGTYD